MTWKIISGFQQNKYEAESISRENQNSSESERLPSNKSIITELFRKYTKSNLRGYDDPIFDLRWIIKGLLGGLLLIKNQLPFFVLHAFSSMTVTPSHREDFHGMIYAFFKNALPAFAFKNKEQQIKGDRKQKIQRGHTFCAMELKEAGIKFMKAEGESLFDIEFENG
ncbi:hypothetical protein WN943_029490 [Citrus x changshan-huyou]